MFDHLYIVISSATLVAAIVSPFFTAIINNRYQLKLKQLELDAAVHEDRRHHQQDIIERYLVAAANCIDDHSLESFSAYYGCYALALQYLPKELFPQMNQLHVYLTNEDTTNALAEYERLALIMPAHIKTLK